MAKPGPWFTDDTLAFLRDLAGNNDRAWFAANRDRYEAHVRQPAFRFIMDFEPRLHRISRHFLADPRPVGGSLFRIHRDTRFSRDKRPYKTHAGIRFPHERNRDVHAPVFYLHIEPGASFIGAGVWHPDSPMLKKIRDAIADDPVAWRRARDDPDFAATFEHAGEMLTRAPRGHDPDHPFIDDLKRKNFAAHRRLDDATLTSDRLLDAFASACADARPFVRFLCSATGLPW